MSYYNSQEEINIQLYSRWEIAVAREQTADGLAFYVALLLAIVVDGKYDSWLWNVVAFVAGWWFTIYGRAEETRKAWFNYENRPILPEVQERYERAENVSPSYFDDA